MHARRLDTLLASLKALDLPALIVSEPSNRRYLTGWATPDPQPGETAYWLLIETDGATIVSHAGNEAEAREAVADARFVGVSGTEMAATRIGALLKATGRARIGYDDDHLSAGDYLRLRAALPEAVELVPVAELPRRQRAIKDVEEIALLREAVAITDRALLALREWLAPGKTEREVAWFVERRVREEGAEGLAFPVLVGSGPTAAFAHHEPTDRPLRPGEPCWIDFGARVGGYSADVSRGFCFSPPDERLQSLYDALIAALDLNVALLQPAADGQAIALRCAAELEGRGFAVGHVGGHGIGLQVHEWPYVERERSVTLVENMVITADPGVYLPGWGGMRVEDDVLITADGPVILSQAPRDLVI